MSAREEKTYEERRGERREKREERGERNRDTSPHAKFVVTDVSLDSHCLPDVSTGV
jgi:hypothetical protein